MKIINCFLAFIVASLGFFAACNNPSENNEEETTISEKTVAGLNGVVVSTVDFDAEKGHFEFDASIISEKEIITAIEKVADQYKVEEWKEEKDSSEENAPSETKSEDKSVTNVKMPTFEIPNIFELLINQL